MKIFFDHDGTLADRIKAEEIPLMKNDGFFFNRKPTELLFQLRNELTGRYTYMLDNIYVCSTYMADCNCLPEKKMWTEKTLPMVKNSHQIFTPMGVNKALAVADYFGKEKLSYDDFLIDDFSRNLFDWKEYGGTGIKYLNGANGNNGTWTGVKAMTFEDIMAAVLTTSAA